MIHSTVKKIRNCLVLLFDDIEDLPAITRKFAEFASENLVKFRTMRKYVRHLLPYSEKDVISLIGQIEMFIKKELRISAIPFILEFRRPACSAKSGTKPEILNPDNSLDHKSDHK